MANLDSVITASTGRTIRTACTAAALGVLSVSTGCVSRVPERQSPLPPHASVRSARTTLIDAEIAAAGLPGASSLLDAIGRLRPEYLQATRDPSGAVELPVVYVDGVRVGDLEHLRHIPASEALDVRFLRRAEARAVLGASAASVTMTIAVRLRRTG